METTRDYGRQVTFALIFGGMTALAAGPAAPASACNGSYAIQPGDMLGAIAKRCDTTVEALLAANDVNPRNLQLGQVLTIPAGDNASAEEIAKIGKIDGEPTLRESARRQDGIDDTAIATGEAEAKKTVPGAADLLAGADLERMQSEFPNAVLSASKGQWRRTVDLAAEGLAPRELVRIAVSDGSGQWITLGDIAANDEGVLEARARIPVEISGAGGLTFAMQRPWGAHVAVDYEGGTAIAKRSSPAEEQASAEVEDTGTKVAMTGKVVSGGGCALLVTPQGNYAIEGQGLRPGSEVMVTGTTRGTGGSCIGAQASITVSSIRQL